MCWIASFGLILCWTTVVLGVIEERGKQSKQSKIGKQSSCVDGVLAIMQALQFLS